MRRRSRPRHPARPDRKAELGRRAGRHGRVRPADRGGGSGDTPATAGDGERVLRRTTRGLHDDTGAVADPPWGESLEGMMARWAKDMGVPYLGRALVGHAQTNHVVPFGIA